MTLTLMGAQVAVNHACVEQHHERAWLVRHFETGDVYACEHVVISGNARGIYRRQSREWPHRWFVQADRVVLHGAEKVVYP